MNNIHGHCLCGMIECEIKEYGNFIYVCHCKMCRRQFGGPAHAVDPGTSKNFMITKGQEFVKLYQSSNDVERGFCSQCGTRLFWHKQSDDHYCVSAGLFDDITANGKLQLELFYDKKPDYYSYQQETKKMDSSYQEI